MPSMPLFQNILEFVFVREYKGLSVGELTNPWIYMVLYTDLEVKRQV